MSGTNSSQFGAQSVEQSQAERFMAMSGMVDSPFSVQSELFGNAEQQQVILASAGAMENDGFEDVTPMQAAVTNRQGRHADPDWKVRAREILENPESVPLATEERIRGELEERERHADTRASAQQSLEQQLGGQDVEAIHRSNVSEAAAERRAERDSRAVQAPRDWNDRDPLADIDAEFREVLQERAQDHAAEFVEGATVGEFMRDVAARVAYVGDSPLDALEGTIQDWQEDGRMHKRLGDINPFGESADEDDEESVAAEIGAELDAGATVSEAINRVTDGEWPEMGCQGWSDIEGPDLVPRLESPRDVSIYDGDDNVNVRVQVDQLWDPAGDSQFQVGLVKPVDDAEESGIKMKFTIWKRSNADWDTPDGEERLVEGDVLQIRGARVNAWYKGGWRTTLAADSDTLIRVEERGEGGSPDGAWDVEVSYEGDPQEAVSQDFSVATGTGPSIGL
ncbi:hypothetical protein RH831_10585 [Halodesulfurarchaeum sp. HSR-GB]|uniref:hypothetical protein n=1 Tax=Halodesulfurarchaeum sp. HSR-GB TaxID=3074077 RepID=UPI0028592B33|nr:hypothetical protein [Halodesulfurarchaeum sp. HSR-GB]MDR5657623.1 hypothetical protein [Halodesulfurarchaeum sp. HSR-GB]